MTELTTNAATMNGRMTKCYGEIKEYGFYYGVDMRATQKVVVGVNEYVEKAFSESITNLSPGKYYYRAFATNATATGYGPWKGFMIGEQGDNDVITVNLDGQALTFDVQPIIVNDRTLVPLRAIFEALGTEVQWYEETQTVKAIKADTEVTLVIDGEAYINGELATLDVPARIVNDRTLVPLRFVSEAMDCQVDWIDTTQTVLINSNPL
ncbi:MAG: copper amine oxidase N-terminal domain-containing protein [Desulfotomaculaceae bacterium]|nr:copper amine oxidase N-terminal domain-containing protein [Desulfotomaculaceae bacterium]